MNREKKNEVILALAENSNALIEFTDLHVQEIREILVNITSEWNQFANHSAHISDYHHLQSIRNSGLFACLHELTLDIMSLERVVEQDEKVNKALWEMENKKVPAQLRKNKEFVAKIASAVEEIQGSQELELIGKMADWMHEAQISYNKSNVQIKIKMQFGRKESKFYTFHVSSPGTKNSTV